MVAQLLLFFPYTVGLLNVSKKMNNKKNTAYLNDLFLLQEKRWN